MAVRGGRYPAPPARPELFQAVKSVIEPQGHTVELDYWDTTHTS
jgi:hypothetical protein